MYSMLFPKYQTVHSRQTSSSYAVQTARRSSWFCAAPTRLNGAHATPCTHSTAPTAASSRPHQSTPSFAAVARKMVALRRLAAVLLLAAGRSDALSSRRTPVMGWSTWSVYGCDISEQLIKEQALAIDRLGLRELGYTYIDIDDW